MDKNKLNEKAVLIYLEIQRNKREFGDTIEEEYTEKVNFLIQYLIALINILNFD